MQTVDLLILHGLVVTLDDDGRVLEDGALAISDGQIVEVGGTARIESRYRANERIEAVGHLVMPGLINAHTHLAMTLFRGLADDLPLESFLEKIWQAEGMFIRPDTVQAGARLAMIEMIRGGTTMAVDMYWFPEAACEEADEIGFRLMNGPVYVDFEGPDGIPAASRTEQGRAFLQTISQSPTLAPAVLPHGTYTVSPEYIRQAGALADEFGIPLHIHASETISEVDTVKERYGFRPIEHLDSMGLLHRRTTLAHCVHVTEDEIHLLAERGAAVVHCPLSNLKTAAGIAPVPEMLASGIPVLLGSDGAATGNDLDMWKVMRVAAILHRGENHDATTNPAPAVVRMATREAAHALGLGDRLGSLEPGKRADVLLIDLKRPHLTPLFDVYSLLVYAVGREDVATVLIDGRVVMRDRRLLAIDETSAMARVSAIARQIQSQQALPG